MVSIRNRLSALKRDRASYMRSKDIYPLWDEAKEQLLKLKEVRGCDISPTEHRNRLDDLCEDVFMLLSLGFMSVGKCKESKPLPYMQRFTQHTPNSTFSCSACRLCPSCGYETVF
jgi:hypothetical protein